MAEAIRIDAVGIVCTRHTPNTNFVGVTRAQGFSIAFFVADGLGGYSVDVSWRGVRVTGGGDTIGEAYEDAKDTATSYVPALRAELVALEWAEHVARREERQAREAEAEADDEAANGI